jgi:hypothetical protein
LVEQWRYSQGLRFSAADALKLLHETLKAKPRLVRVKNQDGNMVVGSIVDAHRYQVLLVQLLGTDEANQESVEERIRKCASILFSNEDYRASLTGSFGVVKTKCGGQTLEQAVDYFYKRYVGNKYTGDKEIGLRSDVGREFVRLHLSRWFS